VISRTLAIEHVVAAVGPRDVVVGGLGFLSRDLYARTSRLRERCFYCMGSMGSVVPIALGLSLAQPSIRIFALEGDGSLLMNLGTLATLRRYGSPRVKLCVFDNGCYESTGGQRSQPDGLQLECVCAAVGLDTHVATSGDHIDEFFTRGDAHVLVIKTARCATAGRIDEGPEDLAARFSEALAQLGPAFVPEVPR